MTGRESHYLQTGWINMERGNKIGALINRINHLIGRRAALNFLDNTAALVHGEMSGQSSEIIFYMIVFIFSSQGMSRKEREKQNLSYQFTFVSPFCSLVSQQGQAFT